MAANPSYVGRFAPSPTGPLHFGSLVAALASYLDARHNHGAWLLRIEDLDPPRESRDAPDQIIQQLKRLCFDWDGDPIFQSQRLSRYEAILERLHKANLLFRCTCSRKSFDKVYPGRCRGNQTATDPYAIRIQVPDSQLAFTDLIQGEQNFQLAEDIGDFILKRKDGLFAYQLAVVVDDFDQGITHIIRGSDLLDSTPRQLYISQRLNFREIEFGHVPVVVDQQGQKLSKQSHAEPIALDSPARELKKALALLNQPIPSSEDLEVIMDSAIHNWRLGNVPNQLHTPMPSP